MESESKTIYLARESMISSLVSDFFTFACIAFLWILNHKFLNGSDAIDVFVGILALICGIGRETNKKKTIDEAIAYLQALKKEGGGGADE